MSIFNVQKKPTKYRPPVISGMKHAPSHLEISEIAVKKLRSIIKIGSETDAHNILIQYPNLLYCLMRGTGHHGTWYASKPYICPPLTNGRKGKIPDFLIAGRSSIGLEWFVIELKSPQENLFNRKGDCFSVVANQGLNQLARYLNYCTQYQSTVRDAYGLKDFRTPKGILLLGNEEETFSEEKEELKSFWNSSLQNIEIISYSRILHNAQAVIDHRKKYLKKQKKWELA